MDNIDQEQPTVSDMGRIWEQQILAARSILNALFKTHNRRSLNGEALQMLLIEVEGMVNLRTMITDTINDVQSHFLFSPSNLLTMKSKVFMPPPGSF